MMDQRRLTNSIELETQDLSSASNWSTSVLQADLSRPTPQSGNNVGIEHQLAPADGGSAAWQVLWAAFMFEAVLWGEHRANLW